MRENENIKDDLRNVQKQWQMMPYTIQITTQHDAHTYQEEQLSFLQTTNVKQI